MFPAGAGMNRFDHRGGRRGGYAFIKRYDKQHNIVIDAAIKDSKMVLY